jgi:phosphoribosylaminoimidazole carboxylase
VVKSATDIPASFTQLGGDRGEPLYAEKFVPFVKELAVMVVRTRVPGATEDTVLCYPVVETIQKDGICDTVIAPAQVSSSANDAALAIARDAILSLRGWGIFGVELFLLSDGTVLLNEIAPRSIYYISF